MIEDFSKLNLAADHYLRIAKEKDSNYFTEFINSMTLIKEKVPEKDFKVFWDDKMQLNKAKFDRKAFIQGACEVAVAAYFSSKNDFKVEVKVNPKNKKDVDTQFKSGGFTYNIEVKCASFEAKEKIPGSDSFVFQTLGRLPNKNELIQTLSRLMDQGLANQGKPLKPHLEQKNMDNNLKDFLISAHEKFNSESSEQEINILLIGCNDTDDMQSWVGYLTASCGLFTADSYCDPAFYNNVDLVVLTNLYYKHKDFYQKNVEGSWTLQETLNLSIVNPFSKKKNPTGILAFNNEIINYNTELNEFIVPGSAPENIKNVFQISHFVIDCLQKKQGKYLFGKRKQQ